jgi:hypothetical protein
VTTFSVTRERILLSSKQAIYRTPRRHMKNPQRSYRGSDRTRLGLGLQQGSKAKTNQVRLFTPHGEHRVRGARSGERLIGKFRSISCQDREFRSCRTKRRRILLSLSIAICWSLLLSVTSAHAETFNICIGDVGPGRCFPADFSFDCGFARAHATDTDVAAAQEFCSRRKAKLINATRIDVHSGGACGYIVVSVTCSN